MEQQELGQFKTRLAQAIFWCAPRADLSNPASSLRTPQLRPRLLEESRFSAVETVANARELFGGVGIRKATIPDNLAGGRLLIYFPNYDLACGATEQETEGFFDVNNVPPWDTWVAYVQDARSVESYDTEYLIAWIPREFVALADEGITVNPEQCIKWLKDTPVELVDILRAEKLLA
ncbi:MAG: hypothetical protein M3362_01880 [Acidobacteriota bacterium]|nr:hypothetical protein [Acidobacteriota bacterium]